MHMRIFLIVLLCGFLFPRPAFPSPEQGATRNALPEDSGNAALKEPAGMRTLIRLFKKDRREFRRTAWAYLERHGYPAAESLALLRLFSCGMFSEACDPRFTEDLCRKLESIPGPADTDLLFLRAANLETFIPQESYELYRRILDNESYSPLKEELVKKLHLLSCYLDRREAFFQWCSQKQIRPELYVGGTETLPGGLPQKIMRLSHTPHRTFIGRPVRFKAPFQGARATPFVEDTAFQWYLTSTAIRSQLPFLENAFYREGFREVAMDTAALKKEQSCFLDVAPVYYLSILPRDGTHFPVHSLIDFKAMMVPYFPESLYTVKWYIEGDGQKVLSGSHAQMYAQQKGAYRLTVIVKFGLYTIQKQVRFYVE